MIKIKNIVIIYMITRRLMRQRRQKVINETKKKLEEERKKQEEKDKAINKENPLKIEPFKTQASKHKNPALMTEIGIKHPFSIAIFGMTGSGKTVLACNLLCNINMFRGFFDTVFLFSPTGKSDDTFSHLKLPEEQIITENEIQRLKNIVEIQRDNVEEQGLLKSDRICLIFEDLTSNKALMNSQHFMQVFIQNRHLNISTIAICHKVNALLRVARLNSHHLMAFPCTNSEIEVLMEEHRPPNMSKEQFKNIIKEAFRQEETNTHPFLWINNKCEFNKKFRKSLNEILSTNVIQDKK